MNMLDPVSLSTLFLQTKRNGAVLASAATGFVVRDTNNKDYLVTNFHVLSGLDAQTLKTVNGHIFSPDVLSVRTLKYTPIGNGDAQLEWNIDDLTIGDFDLESDRWWCHPDFMSRRIDVAVLPLPPEWTSLGIQPMNVVGDNCPAHPRPGSDAFVVGFPLGISVSFLPVWKRASIASEFSVPVDGEPKFLIDASTREGMSGSPVLFRSYSEYVDSAGNLFQQPGLHSRLLGVYSGRVKAVSPDDQLGAQLGVVWRLEVVAEIIQASQTYSSVLRNHKS